MILQQTLDSTEPLPQPSVVIIGLCLFVCLMTVKQVLKDVQSHCPNAHHTLFFSGMSISFYKGRPELGTRNCVSQCYPYTSPWCGEESLLEVA